MKKTVVTLSLMVLFFSSLQSQEIIPLYLDSPPNVKQGYVEAPETPTNASMIRVVNKPTLEAYLPESTKATGAAVIICPGGGYSVIVYQSEGITTAKELAKNGIAAFVLKYRLPNDAAMTDKTIGSLQDAQQAIKLVRERASTWGISPKMIGIMGFSAGGHLASTVATHYKQALIPNSNNTSLRPDFQVLVYPVVTLQDDLTHKDSRKQLLGATPTKAQIDLYSNELQVDETTPIAWITHATDDQLVDVDNSIQYYEALRHHKVSVEMHLYPTGGHGFVSRQKGWMEPLLTWMNQSLIR